MRPPRITKSCRKCGASFSIPPCRDWREHYCSSICRNQYNSDKSAELNAICIVCGTGFRGRRSVSIKTCSLKCMGIAARGRKQTATAIRNRLQSWIANGNREKQQQRRGPLHPQHMGRVVRDGYVHIWVEGTGYVAEHIYIMERELGRELRRNEVVHHKNRNKSDNRIDNLQVMTRAEHLQEHRQEICR